MRLIRVTIACLLLWACISNGPSRGEQVAGEPTTEPATQLAAQSQPQATDPDAFIKAACADKVEVVKALLAAGANPNRRRSTHAQPPQGLTPSEQQSLGLPVAESQPGTSTTATSRAIAHFRTEGEWARVGHAMEAWKHNEYPLHAAVFGRRADVAELLLKAGANPNLTLSDGDTPLHTAARSFDDNMVRLLLAHGADVRARDVQGRTPLFNALIPPYGDPLAVIDTLVKAGTDIDARDSHGRTALHQAVVNASAQNDRRSLAVMRHLLELGAAVDTTDDQNASPLTSASGAAAEMLLYAGAKPTAQDARHVTPLHRAAEFGGQVKAAALIRYGADIEAATATGDRPLHWAARAGREELILLLIRNKADLTAKNVKGQTPLDVAMEAGHYAAAKLIATHLPEKPTVDPLKVLLANDNERKAIEDLAPLLAQQDVPMRQKQLNERLAQAANAGHLAVAERIIAAGWIPEEVAPYYDPRYSAAMRGHWMIVKALLIAGADAKKPNLVGPSPLHEAVQWGNIETARLLIEAGADVNLPVPEASTGVPGAGLRPIYIAAETGDFAMVEMLLEHGAKVNAQRLADGLSPLMLAAMGGRTDLIELFLKRGANPALKSRNGLTAFDFAVREKHSTIAQILAAAAGKPTAASMESPRMQN